MHADFDADAVMHVTLTAIEALINPQGQGQDQDQGQDQGKADTSRAAPIPLAGNRAEIATQHDLQFADQTRHLTVKA